MESSGVNDQYLNDEFLLKVFDIDLIVTAEIACTRQVFKVSTCEYNKTPKRREREKNNLHPVLSHFKVINKLRINPEFL